MTELLLWVIHQLAALASVLAVFFGAMVGLHGTPVSAGPAPTPAAVVTPAPAGPVSPIAPSEVYGPTPRCVTGMGSKADRTRGWYGVCVVHGQARTFCCWPTQRAARAAIHAFQQAWRDVVRARARL